MLLLGCLLRRLNISLRFSQSFAKSGLSADVSRMRILDVSALPLGSKQQLDPNYRSPNTLTNVAALVPSENYPAKKLRAVFWLPEKHNSGNARLGMEPPSGVCKSLDSLIQCRKGHLNDSGATAYTKGIHCLSRRSRILISYA